MISRESSRISYSEATLLPGATVGLPSLALSAASYSAPSSPDHTSGLRAFDILGVPIFDYAGNMAPATLIAFGATIVGIGAERLISKDRQRPVVVAGVMAVASAGVSIGFEAATSERIDVGDATIGVLTGLAYSVVFCIAALRQRSRSRLNK